MRGGWKKQARCSSPNARTPCDFYTCMLALRLESGPGRERGPNDHLEIPEDLQTCSRL